MSSINPKSNEGVLLITQACYGRMHVLRHALLTDDVARFKLDGEKPVSIQAKAWRDELDALEHWWHTLLTEPQRQKIIALNGELSTGYKSLIRGYRTDGTH